MESLIYNTIQNKLSTVFRPPPKLTVSEWAEKERQLPKGSSAMPGKWKSFNFQIEPMDAFNDPKVETVVIMSCTQLLKTENLLNTLGFIIHHQPDATLFIQPTLDAMERFSKKRIAGMFKATPCLNEIMGDGKTRDKDNTILYKTFPWGSVLMVGSNSVAGLTSDPIRYVLADEVDRYVPTKEGDAIELAEKRTDTYWNSKRLYTSTPTIKDVSRIESLYLESDQRKYFVPCQSCGEYQVMTWENVKWESKKNKSGKSIHYPETAHYECPYCKHKIYEAEKNLMVSKGEWRPTAKFTGTAGFWINQLYSPWPKTTLVKTVKKFLKAIKRLDTHQVFINTVLAETWEIPGDEIDEHVLYSRREDYKAEVPAGVGYLTASVDVQDDRLEVTVVGWGKEEELWGIEHIVIDGEPDKKHVWEQIDELRKREFEHESGAKLKIRSITVDSGGHYTKTVYSYCKKRSRVYAIKGVPGDKDIVGRPTQKSIKKLKIRLYTVGTYEAKRILFARMKIEEPGPGYMHFPKEARKGFDEEYFKQLTAEKCIKTEKKGVKVIEWVKTRPRNEALDLMVYNFAAFLILPVYNIGKKVDELNSKSKEENEETGQEVKKTKKRRPLRRKMKWNRDY